MCTKENAMPWCSWAVNSLGLDEGESHVCTVKGQGGRVVCLPLGPASLAGAGGWLPLPTAAGAWFYPWARHLQPGQPWLSLGKAFTCRKNVNSGLLINIYTFLKNFKFTHYKQIENYLKFITGRDYLTPKWKPFIKFDSFSLGLSTAAFPKVC